MSNKSPHPVDEHVGMRVRMRRMLKSVSQEKLGEQLGVTFQQVQKYEKGSNRVSASRLFEIARILEVPVTYFFDGYNNRHKAEVQGFAEDDSAPVMLDFLATSEGLRLVRAFTTISNPLLRKSILDHVEALSSQGNAAKN